MWETNIIRHASHSGGHSLPKRNGGKLSLLWNVRPPLLSSFCFYSLSFCIQPSLFLTRYRRLQVILGTNALLDILSFICTGSLLYCCYNQLHKLKTIRSYAGLKQHRSITSEVCRSEGRTGCSRFSALGFPVLKSRCSLFLGVNPLESSLRLLAEFTSMQPPDWGPTSSLAVGQRSFSASKGHTLAPVLSPYLKPEAMDWVPLLFQISWPLPSGYFLFLFFLKLHLSDWLSWPFSCDSQGSCD